MEQYVENLVQDTINKIKNKENVHGIGRVMTVQNYILEVSGLENVRFYEKVIIGAGSEGYVNSIRRNSVMVAVVRRKGDIYVGDQVTASGETFHISFAEESMGHVTDIFGTDRSCGKTFEQLENLNIENPNIPIMDRTAVCRPLETGIAGVDLIYPIGKGQRQLIIGDKKTGKTQIALDAIVNQKGKDVICIYISVGKTK